MKSTIFVGAVTPVPSHPRGLYRREPGETEWQSLEAGLPADLQVNCIVTGRENSDVLLIGTQRGVFRSEDRGDSWIDLGVPEECKPVYSLLIHPGEPTTIYAGSDDTVIYRTDDRGASWRSLPTVQPAGALTSCFPVRVLKMTVDPTNTDEIYAALEVGGVIRSLDGGENWDDISGGLLKLSEQPHLRNCILSDNLSEGMMDLHALTVSSEQPGKLWVANRMGLFVSEDRGDNWREFGIGRFSDLTYARDLAVSPHDPKVFIAALSTSSRGDAGSVYTSSDTGETWQRLDHDISIDSTVMNVAINKNDPNRVYCAARLGQILGTEDGGATWNSFPLPDGVQDVRAIVCT